MSNAVRFLASLACDPSAGSQPEQVYRQVVDALDVTPEARTALLRRDAAALSRALGARENVMLFLLPAEDEDQAPQPAESPDTPEQEPTPVPAAD